MKRRKPSAVATVVVDPPPMRRAGRLEIAIGLCVGALLIGVAAASRLPPAERIERVEGALASVVKTGGRRPDLRVRIDGDPRVFSYQRKSGAFDTVWTSMADSVGQPVTLAFDAQPTGEWFAPPAHHRLVAITVDDRPVRRQADVVSSWKRQNLGLALLGGAFCAYGLWAGVAAGKRRR